MWPRLVCSRALPLPSDPPRNDFPKLGKFACQQFEEFGMLQKDHDRIWNDRCMNDNIKMNQMLEAGPWSRACPEIQSRCFLGKTPHGQILHPMPFDQIFGFPDFPKIREIGISGNADFRFSRISKIRFSKVRISGNPKLQNFGFPDFRISENPDFRKSPKS